MDQVAGCSIPTEKTKTPNAKTKNLKDASIPAGARKVKKIIATIPVTRGRRNTMIIDSIKALKTHNGASFEDICMYMGNNYKVNMELWKPEVSKFLKENVQSGVLEKANDAAGQERFKLAKSAAIENVQQNLLSKDGMQSKAEKRKIEDLPENRKMKKKVAHSVVSDIETSSKNDAGESSTMIEILEAVPGPSTDAVPQIETTTESISNIVAKKRARSAKDKSGFEKSETTSAKAEKVKLVSAPESKNLKNNADHPSTSEMVLDSIKALKKRKGATFDDISKHMEEKYQVNMKVFKSHVNKFLKKSVDEGLLEKSTGVKVGERYKIKKSGSVKKDPENSRTKKEAKLVAKKQVKS